MHFTYQKNIGETPYSHCNRCRKTFDKNQHTQFLKFSKIGIERKSLNLIRASTRNPWLTSLWFKMEWFPPNIRSKARGLIPPLVLSVVLNVLLSHLMSYLVTYGKKKRHTDGKGRCKLAFT